MNVVVIIFFVFLLQEKYSNNKRSAFIHLNAHMKLVIYAIFEFNSS